MWLGIWISETSIRWDMEVSESCIDSDSQQLGNTTICRSHAGQLIIPKHDGSSFPNRTSRCFRQHDEKNLHSTFWRIWPIVLEFARIVIRFEQFPRRSAEFSKRVMWIFLLLFGKSFPISKTLNSLKFARRATISMFYWRKQSRWCDISFRNFWSTASPSPSPSSLLSPTLSSSSKFPSVAYDFGH